MAIEIFLAVSYITSPLQRRRENTEAPGQKRKTRPLRARRAEDFRVLDINYARLLLVYFMKSPDIEELGVARPLGP